VFAKNKKIVDFLNARRRNDNLMSLCFITRILPFPFNILCMLFGALGMPYVKYLIVSLLGLSPAVILFILTGASISDPFSLEFIIPFVISLTVTAIVFIIYNKQTIKVNNLINTNIDLQQKVEEKTMMVAELQSAILKTMSELVEFRDDITGKHIERTQYYLKIMLSALQKQGIYEKEISTWDIGLVLQSAQLHDVGKIAIKDSILQKPDKLIDDEFAEIKKHTIFGEKVIEKIKENTTDHSFLEYAQIVAVSHHEKWNGSGYPDGLKGEEIPLLGRIMAIVDVYDALISERPYKKALTHENAVEIIIKDRGTHFDPVLIDVFISVSDEFKICALYKNSNHAQNASNSSATVF
jgi:HD-GYP domain-containing protein (c-di-GMP phosphodiesterase class II)